MKMSALTLALTLVTSYAFAGETTVVQNQLSFQDAGGAPLQEVKIKAGDTVKFVNNDSTEHNVFFSAPDVITFIQPPKSEPKSHKFDKAGTYNVRCAIHPKMKLKIVAE